MAAVPEALPVGCRDAQRSAATVQKFRISMHKANRQLNARQSLLSSSVQYQSTCDTSLGRPSSWAVSLPPSSEAAAFVSSAALEKAVPLTSSLSAM